MGKRIRHLEFYGYADQNVYMGIPNIDLSDIREVNREQDKEINEISGVTKGKADLSTVNELSGKVDTFIGRQSIINGWFIKGIKKNKERIDNLETRDEEITNKINEIVDSVDGLSNGIDAISAKTTSLENRLNNHIDESEEFEDRINSKVNTLEDKLSEKIDRTEAYDTFAKKEDTYTKREVNDLINGQSQEYASKQWVLNQGYLKETDANDKFATKTRLQALDDRVTGIQTDLYGKYSDLTSDLNQFKSTTNDNFNNVNNKVDNLINRYNIDVEDLMNKTNVLRRETDQNTEAIRLINDVSLPAKADKSDVDGLICRVDTLQNSLNTKVDKADYSRDWNILNSDLEYIRTHKADKTELAAVSGDVLDINDRLNQEIQDRIAGDAVLDGKNRDTNLRIDEIREENIDRDLKIRNLQRDLQQEHDDRVERDNEIIGNSSDYDDDITIYGARKYADKVARQAFAEAKEYAEVKDSVLKNYVDEQDYLLDRKITAKADKTYVDGLRNELQQTIDDKVQEETARATRVENSLDNAIQQERARATTKENNLSNVLVKANTLLHVLTEYTGNTREEYTDAGNGVVDVMHREIHDMNISLFADARFNELDYKIHFYSKYGNEVCSVDMSDFTQTVIEETWYNNGIIYIKFTNGDVVEIDVKELVDENEFSDGLQVVDGIVSVLKDVTSENYISVSSAGIKISGIDSKFSILNEKIDAEISRSETYDEALQNLIDEERSRAIAVEEEISNRIDNLTIDCGIY